MFKFLFISPGIWLLQMIVQDPENYQDVEDDCFVTIKDSKYVLETDKVYVVVQFTGSMGFIFS